MLCLSTLARADANSLLGTWQLKSFVREVAGTGERHNQLGDRPDGHIGYSPDGRMLVFFVAADQPRPRNEPRHSDLRTWSSRQFTTFGCRRQPRSYPGRWLPPANDRFRRALIFRHDRRMTVCKVDRLLDRKSATDAYGSEGRVRGCRLQSFGFRRRSRPNDDSGRPHDLGVVCMTAQ